MTPDVTEIKLSETDLSEAIGLWLIKRGFLGNADIYIGRDAAGKIAAVVKLVRAKEVER